MMVSMTITTAVTTAGGGAITQARGGGGGGGAWMMSGTDMTRIMGEIEAGARMTTDAVVAGLSTTQTNTDLQDLQTPILRCLQEVRPQVEPRLVVHHIRQATRHLPPCNRGRHLFPQAAQREVSRLATFLTPISTAHPSRTSTHHLRSLSRRHPSRAWIQCRRTA